MGQLPGSVPPLSERLKMRAAPEPASVDWPNGVEPLAPPRSFLLDDPSGAGEVDLVDMSPQPFLDSDRVFEQVRKAGLVGNRKRWAEFTSEQKRSKLELARFREGAELEQNIKEADIAMAQAIGIAAFGIGNVAADIRAKRAGINLDELRPEQGWSKGLQFVAELGLIVTGRPGRGLLAGSTATGKTFAQAAGVPTRSIFTRMVEFGTFLGAFLPYRVADEMIAGEETPQEALRGGIEEVGVGSVALPIAGRLVKMTTLDAAKFMARQIPGATPYFSKITGYPETVIYHSGAKPSRTERRLLAEWGYKESTNAPGMFTRPNTRLPMVPPMEGAPSRETMAEPGGLREWKDWWFDKVGVIGVGGGGEIRDPQYAYHVTSADNMASIAGSGMVPKRPLGFTRTPKGEMIQDAEGVYFSDDPEFVNMFRSDVGYNSLYIRTLKTNLTKLPGVAGKRMTPEYISKGHMLPEKLEYLTESGEWVPFKRLPQEGLPVRVPLVPGRERTWREWWGRKLGVTKPNPSYRDLPQTIDPDYAYHVTSEESLQGISEVGLIPKVPGGMNITAEGRIIEHPKGVYFSDSPHMVGLFQQHIRNVYVRTRKSNLARLLFEGEPEGASAREYISRRPVPAEQLEYLTAEGKWVPLKSSTPQQRALRDHYDVVSWNPEARTSFKHLRELIEEGYQPIANPNGEHLPPIMIRPKWMGPRSFQDFQAEKFPLIDQHMEIEQGIKRLQTALTKLTGEADKYGNIVAPGKPFKTVTSPTEPGKLELRTTFEDIEALERAIEEQTQRLGAVDMQIAAINKREADYVTAVAEIGKTTPLRKRLLYSVVERLSRDNAGPTANRMAEQISDFDGMRRERMSKLAWLYDHVLSRPILGNDGTRYVGPRRRLSGDEMELIGKYLEYQHTMPAWGLPQLPDDLLWRAQAIDGALREVLKEAERVGVMILDQRGKWRPIRMIDLSRLPVMYNDKFAAEVAVREGAMWDSAVEYIMQNVKQVRNITDPMLRRAEAQALIVEEGAMISDPSAVRILRRSQEGLGAALRSIPARIAKGRVPGSELGPATPKAIHERELLYRILPDEFYDWNAYRVHMRFLRKLTSEIEFHKKIAPAHMRHSAVADILRQMEIEMGAAGQESRLIKMDFQFMTDQFERIFHTRTTSQSVRNVLNFFRNWPVIQFIGLNGRLVLQQLAQLNIGAGPMMGYRTIGKSVLDFATGKVSPKDVRTMGALIENFMELVAFVDDAAERTALTGKLAGISTIPTRVSDNIGRGITANAGVIAAEDAARVMGGLKPRYKSDLTPARAKQFLEMAGIKGTRLTEAMDRVARGEPIFDQPERARIMRHISDRWYLRPGVLALPGWITHEVSRVLLQFFSFGYLQGAKVFARDVVGSLFSRDPNPRPLIRLLMMGNMSGEAIYGITNYLTGQRRHVRGEVAGHKIPGPLVPLRVVQNLVMAGSLGMFEILRDPEGRLPSLAMGPTGRNLMTLIRLVQGIGERRSWRELAAMMAQSGTAVGRGLSALVLTGDPLGDGRRAAYYRIQAEAGVLTRLIEAGPVGKAFGVDAPRRSSTPSLWLAADSGGYGMFKRLAKKEMDAYGRLPKLGDIARAHKPGVPRKGLHFTGHAEFDKAITPVVQKLAWQHWDEVKDRLYAYRDRFSQEELADRATFIPPVQGLPEAGELTVPTLEERMRAAGR